jgi:hypothetical protein
MYTQFYLSKSLCSEATMELGTFRWPLTGVKKADLMMANEGEANRVSPQNLLKGGRLNQQYGSDSNQIRHKA